MTKNVLTETVRELSEQAAGSVPHDAVSPSRDFFLENIRGRFKAQLSSLKNDLHNATDDERKAKLQKAIQRNQERAKRFDETIQKVPAQFSLSELMYTRITSEQNKTVMKEFSTYVRPRFLMFLAEKFPKELKQLGICDHGIDRMKNGLDPQDEDRNVYNMTVDHIIERSGSGNWGYDKEMDEGIHNGHRETYKANHFANLTMLPSTIHSDIKNVINDVQDLPSLHSGEAKWFLSMIPRGETEAECYMYVPETTQARDEFVAKHKRKVSNEISHLNLDAMQLISECDVFQEYAKMAEENSAKKKGTKAKKLAKAFNKEHDMGRVYHRRVKPLLAELHDTLESVEARIQKLKKRDAKRAAEYEKMLVRTLRSRQFSLLNKKIREVEAISGKPDGRALFSRRRRVLDELSGQKFSAKKDSQAQNRKHGQNNRRS